MRRLFSWLWQRLTAERLAVAVFLAVAVGLWWGMPSRPEQVIVFQTDGCEPECEFSPDGTLCLVKERRDIGEKLQGNAPKYPWEHRLRVFEVATGQELWRWDSGQEQVWKAEWTKRNQLLVLLPNAIGRKDGVPAVGRLLGFAPRAGQTPFFQHEWPASEHSDYLLIAPDGNLVVLVHSPADATCHIELADLRTRVVKSFLHTRGTPEGWFWPFEFSAAWPWQYAEDGTALLCAQRQYDGMALLLYDVNSGRLRQRFRSDSHALRSHPATSYLPFMQSTDLAISPDGRLLAVCHDQQSAHDTVRVWDLASGQLLATLDGFRPQRLDTEGKPEKWGVGNLLFTPDSSRLCVGVGRVDYGSGGEGVFGTSELHLFETHTFGRLASMEGEFPQVSGDSRYVTFIGKHSAGYDLMVLDVRRERAAPTVLVPEAVVAGFGFLPSGGQSDLHYVRTDRKIATVPWFQQVRRWLGLQAPSDSAMELTFRHPDTGHLYDHWTFYGPLGQPPIILSPQRDRLLVHFPLGNDWHRLEIYALPPRRPWVPIVGWALAAAVLVELLGLGWRWLRRKPIPVPISAE